VSGNPHKTIAGRGRRPGDRRDEAVGAALVGLVVVLVGYASGIGAGGSGGSGPPIAAGGGAPSVPGSSAAPTSAPSTVLVQATPTSGDDPAPADPAGGPVAPNQTFAASTSGGAPPSPVVNPVLPTTPTPTSIPTVIVSQPQTPEPTGSTPSGPSSSDQPSTSPSSAAPTGLLPALIPPNLVPCLLGPVDSLLGLGGLLGQCQTATSPMAGTP
jgi:hypothetical protein